MKRNFFVMLALSAVFLVNSASAALVATYDPANGEVTFSDVSALVGLRINASDASLIDGAATNLDGAASGFFGVVNDSAPNFIEWGNLTGMTFASSSAGLILPANLTQVAIDTNLVALSRAITAPNTDVAFPIVGGLAGGIPEPGTIVLAFLGVSGVLCSRRR